MNFVEFIFSTQPNYLLPQSLSKACLEVNAASLPCKISHYKFTGANCGNYLVINSVIVFNLINSYRPITSLINCWTDGMKPCRMNGLIKPHGDECR